MISLRNEEQFAKLLARGFLRRCRRSSFRRNNGTIFNSRCREFAWEKSRRLSGDFSRIFSYSNSSVRLYYERVNVFLTSIFRNSDLSKLSYSRRALLYNVAGEKTI